MKKRNVFFFIQAALCILLCALLSAGVVRLYAEGMARVGAGDVQSPVFTREAVLEKLTSLIPLFLLALGLLVVSVILHIRNRTPQVRDPETERNLACAGIAEPSEEMQRERGTQKKLSWFGKAGAALCMVPAVLYLCMPSHFESTQLEEVMGALLLHILPWTAAAFGLLCVTECLREKSMERETKAAVVLRRNGTSSAPRPGEEKRKNLDGEKRQQWIRGILLLAAAALIIHGVLNGSMRDVFIKAVHICTECIGLG